LDIGCGEGNQLLQLKAGGCVATGIDVSIASLRLCRQRGLRVVQARAEELPIRTEVVDGVVCKVTLPYTAEVSAVTEIARVLKAGGKVYLCSHAAGYYYYYVRYMAFSPSVRRLFYSLRTLVNTWFYVATRRRLPGFLGDTIYQSRRRLYRYYRNNDLKLREDCPAPNYLGLPVFFYHSVSKVEGE